MQNARQLKLNFTDIPPSEMRTSSSFVSNMDLPVHRWFRFSAGFSAEWVKYEIARRPDEDITVLDPFAGSGTTLLAADECQVTSIGVDAHPFVTRIAKAKLKWDTDISAFQNCVAQVGEAAHGLIPDLEIDIAELPSLLRKSYTEDALVKLFALRKSWEQLADASPASELTWLAITAILRSCSHVGTAPWQYVLPNKRKSTVLDPFDALHHHAEMMQNDMAFLQDFAPSSRARMINGDARNLEAVASDSVDLVITSPPYTNNYDYADATRLELTFWGIVRRWSDLQEAVRKYLVRSCSQHASKEKLDLEDLLDDPYLDPIIDELGPVCRELGDERHLHGGRKKYHLMVAAYFADMARSWEALRRVCKREANICFVIGDSAPYGIHVPVDKWLAQLAHAAGFEVEQFIKTRDRNIKWRNRTHTVPLKEGQLWLALTERKTETFHYMNSITSPGHKLGQMIGNFFEDFFDESLSDIAVRHNVYCDRRGRRPSVRGNRRKVTWIDQDGNPHDLDYVLESGGSFEKRGQPAAFIELAWRRYTKHSRNKAGEIEGALIHLGETYQGAFLGAILGGEFTQGSLDQLESHGVNVLYVPFDKIADAFATKGIDLRYVESVDDDVKLEIIENWQALNPSDLEQIKKDLENRIKEDYLDFLNDLEEALAREVVSVRVFYLFGKESVYDNLSIAIQALQDYVPEAASDLAFKRYEVQIRFNNGDRVEGAFSERKEVVNYLRYFAKE